MFNAGNICFICSYAVSNFCLCQPGFFPGIPNNLCIILFPRTGFGVNPPFRSNRTEFFLQMTGYIDKGAICELLHVAYPKNTVSLQI